MPSFYYPLPEAFTEVAGRRPLSVLLATLRCDAENQRSFLFTEPEGVLAASQAAELPELFVRLEKARRRGCYVAGALAYECGEHFAGGRVVPESPDGAPLAWFGVYPRACSFDHRTGELSGVLPAAAGAACRVKPEVRKARFDVEEPRYAQQIKAIHEWIRAGDTYQVNLTGPMHFEYAGDPMAIFRAVGEGQPVAYAAFLNQGERKILSFSPELFFRVAGSEIVTRPMKGTAPRGRDASEDQRIAAWLAADEKNRAENLMIVDLLRNDLGRICRFGSVRAEELFAVEPYETLFQMVSTVRGQLRPGVGLYEILQAIFPSGSVTGAPKIRTMEIIAELERVRRGVYTGAIGMMAPSGEAVFNVPIRTAVLAGGQGTMGLGSGITIDSCAADEFRECQLKARFLAQPFAATPPVEEETPVGCGAENEPFALLESLLWDGADCPLLELHLDRLEASARSFGFPFERCEVRRRLEALQLAGRNKLRLLLDGDGRIGIESAPIGEPEPIVRVAICPEPVCSGDRFLRHKTTRREFYNRWLARAQRLGCGEILFQNERGELTEGAIRNVFVELGGRLLTPPVECGLLGGVYRRKVLDSDPRAGERVLRIGDLRQGTAVFLTNAVRGMQRAEVVLDDFRLAGQNAAEL